MEDNPCDVDGTATALGSDVLPEVDSGIDLRLLLSGLFSVASSSQTIFLAVLVIIDSNSIHEGIDKRREEEQKKKRRETSCR